jgi:hypothetical protein
MRRIYKLQEHLKNLETEEKLSFAEGDWERLDRIRLAIDATNEQIAQEQPTTWQQNAPYNAQFLGAQPARAGQDY